jgi:hypothetical protein
MATRLVGVMAFSLSIMPLTGGGSVRAQNPVLDQIWGAPQTLLSKDIQDELRLSGEQVRKVTIVSNDYLKKRKDVQARVLARYNKLPPELRKDAAAEKHAVSTAVHQAVTVEADTKLKAILAPGQMRRYKQISVWGRMPTVWGDRDLEVALRLAAGQKSKIQMFLDDNLAEQPQKAEILKQFPDPKEAARQWKVQNFENNNKVTRRALEILDDVQRLTWKEISGDPPSTWVLN